MKTFNINNVMLKVDFNLKRAYCESYKNKHLAVHVYGQHDYLSETSTFYQYPGIACNIKLPKLNSTSIVKLIEFKSNDSYKIITKRLDKKLYYVHHHYAKYYVYGLVPGVVLKNDDLCKLNVFNCYIGSPVFDKNDRLVSFVTDYYYMNENNIGIMPITGESYRMQGMFCLDGAVRVFDTLSFEPAAIAAEPTINIIVGYNKKHVKIAVVYNGSVVSELLIACQYAGNILIL
ncbi:P26 [Buzura suppressaria nucleopolyhedrovirus]|uniref:p26 n=1 Tax=Buzura suppressaria nuclear polyhedrosis virus TaxID=74320 RepID=W5VKF9_NPVBS|nr:P26 [Buzura suppressaria nucleopolyhedrovirus]AHH82641.1 P26 [Buzura suppressaria nucleopolyhedrovirus]AKN91024.1 P26 [Buzura suppressaria nucleopolyhedrovirus]QYF10615.1 P26-b [Buzura suppressaria nucleopolyhedrovirus]